LGQKFIKYRNENILFMGSWNIVHNLSHVSFDNETKPFDRAVQIDSRCKKQIETYDINKLLNYTEYLPDYQLGIPTPDHYIPLIYILGMKWPEESINTIHESIQNGSISMRSVEIV